MSSDAFKKIIIDCLSHCDPKRVKHIIDSLPNMNVEEGLVGYPGEMMVRLQDLLDEKKQGEKIDTDVNFARLCDAIGSKINPISINPDMPRLKLCFSTLATEFIQRAERDEKKVSFFNAHEPRVGSSDLNITRTELCFDDFANRIKMSYYRDLRFCEKINKDDNEMQEFGLFAARPKTTDVQGALACL